MGFGKYKKLTYIECYNMEKLEKKGKKFGYMKWLDSLEKPHETVK